MSDALEPAQYPKEKPGCQPGDQFISKRNSTMTYLTAAETQTAKLVTFRYFVELASTEVDFEGAPQRCRIVDVVVIQPTREAIASLIAASGWLQGYKMVAYWQPEDGCDCF